MAHIGRDTNVTMRIIFVGILVGSILAACGVVPPQAIGPEALGVPLTIGTWKVSDVTPDPDSEAGKMLAKLTDAFFEAAGGSATTSVYAEWRLSDGPERFWVNGARVIGASPEAMLAGARNMGGELGTQVQIVSGWDIRRLDSTGSNAPEPNWIAVRGDRLFWIVTATLEQVTTFLSAVE